MNPETSFVRFEVHAKLLRKAFEEARAEAALGIMEWTLPRLERTS